MTLGCPCPAEVTNADDFHFKRAEAALRRAVA
jgi:hypothetical protein